MSHKLSTAMAQALIADLSPRMLGFDPCGICTGQNSTGTDFPQSTAVLPCQYRSTNGAYTFFNVSPTLHGCSK